MKTIILRNNIILAVLASVLAFLLSFGIISNPLISFIALVGVIIFFLMVVNPKKYLIWILISILSGQLIRIGIMGTGGSLLASDLVVMILVGIWSVRKLILKENINSPSFFWLIGFFLIVSLISTVNALNFLPANSVLISSFYLIRWIFYLGIFYMAYNDIKSETEAKTHFWWIMAIGILVAILGFAQMIYIPDFSFMQRLGWDPHSGRLLSTFFDPNYVGGFFGFIVSLMLGVYFLTDDEKLKRWLVIVGFILLLALVLTFSRSAYLGFLIGFLVIGATRSWKSILIGLAIIAVLLAIFPKSLNRIEKALTVDETAQTRILSWQRGWQVISDHPLLGVGFNTLPYVKADYDFINGEKITHSASGSDSSLLTLWQTSGIFSLLFYLIFYVYLIINGFKIFKDKKNSRFLRGLGLGFSGGLIGLFFHSQFVNSLLYPPIMILIWLVAGIILNLKQKTKN